MASSLEDETLGEVQIGMRLSQVIAKFGHPNSMTKEVKDRGHNCWVRIYDFDRLGIEVETCRRGRIQTVRSLRAVKNPRAQTSSGGHVGASVQEIVRSYRGARLISNHTIVVEDRVNQISLRFLVEYGHVYEINFFKDTTLEMENRRKRMFVI